MANRELIHELKLGENYSAFKIKKKKKKRKKEKWKKKKLVLHFSRWEEGPIVCIRREANFLFGPGWNVLENVGKADSFAAVPSNKLEAGGGRVHAACWWNGAVADEGGGRTRQENLYEESKTVRGYFLGNPICPS